MNTTATDEKKLKALANRYNAEGIYKWVHKEAELEEAFIYLMTGVDDNFIGAAK